MMESGCRVCFMSETMKPNLCCDQERDTPLPDQQEALLLIDQKDDLLMIKKKSSFSIEKKICFLLKRRIFHWDALRTVPPPAPQALEALGKAWGNRMISMVSYGSMF